MLFTFSYGVYHRIPSQQIPVMKWRTHDSQVGFLPLRALRSFLRQLLRDQRKGFITLAKSELFSVFPL